MIATSIPGARIVMIDDADRVVNLGGPAAFDAAVLSFLAEVDRQWDDDLLAVGALLGLIERRRGSVRRACDPRARHPRAPGQLEDRRHKLRALARARDSRGRAGRRSLGRRLAAAAAGWCFVLGTVLFQADLYALALTDKRKLGAITPIGGVLLMLRMALLVVAAIRGR